MNCPMEPAAELAKMYSLRATALNMSSDYQKALLNVDLAIKLEPTELLYYVQKVKYLCAHNQFTKAMNFIADLLNRWKTNAQDKQTKMWLRKLYNCIKNHINTKKDSKSNLETNHDDSQANEQEEKQNFEFDYRFRLESNFEKGRHFVASDEIPVDTLILTERAYSMVIQSDHLLDKCHYCAQSVSNCFWPCAGCNCTVYCNPKCAQNDWKLSHQLECGLVKFWLDKSQNTLHVFRQFARVGVDAILDLEKRCDLPPFDMFTYMHDHDQQHLDELHKNPDTRLKGYKTFMSLQHHSNKFDDSLAPEEMVTAIVFAMITFMVHGYGKFVFF